jgi:hypothetical protein
MITIREFNFPDDYETVKNLWERMEKGVHLGRSDSLEEIEKKHLRDPDLFLVAENGQEIIGAVIGGYDGRRGLIISPGSRFGISTTRRGRKIVE